MSDHQKIEQEAAEWLAWTDRGLDLREKLAFDQWLDQSIAHRVSYLRLKANWEMADILAVVDAPKLMLRRRGPGVGAMFSAALAASLVMIFWPAQIGREPSQISTIAAGPSQAGNIWLSDGAKIDFGEKTACGIWSPLLPLR